MEDSQRGPRLRRKGRFPGTRSLVVALALASAMLLAALTAFPAFGPLAAPVAHADTPVALQIVVPGPANGFASGPVGTNVTITGQVATGANDTFQLGWTPQQGGDCTSAFTQMPVAPITADGSGNLTATFPWPTNANGVNTSYLVCALDATHPENGAVASAQAFQVTSTTPPTISIAPGQSGGQAYVAGGTVQITGQSFAPAGTPLDVFLTNQQSFDVADFKPNQALHTVNGSGITTDGSGAFTATVTLPADVTGAMFLHVVSADAPQNYLPALLATQALTISQAPTPTPLPQPTPTLTPANNNSGGGGSNSLAIILLATISVILFIAGVLLIASVAISPRPGGGSGGNSGING